MVGHTMASLALKPKVDGETKSKDLWTLPSGEDAHVQFMIEFIFDNWHATSSLPTMRLYEAEKDNQSSLLDLSS